MENFTNWIEQKGIKSVAIVKETPYAGYGLFSTDNTSCSTVVVQIPNELLLTFQNVLTFSDFYETIKDYFIKKYNVTNLESFIKHKNHEKFVLCLFLIYCQQNKLYSPYLDILPTLDFFKEHHILFNVDCIKDTSLEKSVNAKLALLARELHELHEFQGWFADIDLDTYLWADCVFWSRVVGIGGADESIPKFALIPFFDFANHSHENSNMRWQLSSQGLELITTTDVTKDTELLLSYGSKPNQELLFLHGFSIQDNPEPSCFTLPLSPFLDPRQDPMSMPKIQWLKQMNAKPTLRLENYGTSNSLSSLGWSQESIIVMYLVAMDQDTGIEFSIDNDMIQLYIMDKQVTSLSDLNDVVSSMELLPVIQLRIIMLLIDALKYHYSLITQYSSDYDKPIAKQAMIYRQEETQTLYLQIQLLDELSSKLMGDPVVISYLESVQ